MSPLAWQSCCCCFAADDIGLSCSHAFDLGSCCRLQGSKSECMLGVRSTACYLGVGFMPLTSCCLQDSPIIILDEATSSLDAKTERLMSQALDRLTKGRTTIVVAHRLSTIQAADNIVMLEDGVAVEQGTHEDLISRQTRYKDLVSSQSLTLRR